MASEYVPLLLRICDETDLQTVYAYPFNNNAKKFRTVAAYAGVLDKVSVSEDFKMGETNYTSEYLTNLNPTGQVPALATPDGNLFESEAMAEYFLAKYPTDLVGKTPYESAQIRQWIEFYKNTVQPHLTTWVLPYMPWGVPYNAAAEAEAKDKLKGSPVTRSHKRGLTTLNNQIKKTGYVVADRVTYADVILFCDMNLFFCHVSTPDYFDDLPELYAWAKKLAALPQFKAADYDRDFKFNETKPTVPQ